MFRDSLRRLWEHIDAPEPNPTMMKVQGVPVYLKYPRKGITYSKGAMRWGIAIQSILTLYMLVILLVKAPQYTLINLLISWWLLISNFLALVPKIVLFKMFVSLKDDQPVDSLRTEMGVIFKKRIYYYNVVFTALCLANNILCMPVSICIWGYEDEVPDLFIYSLIFLLRYFYSMYRFSRYFMSGQNTNNQFCLPEITFGAPDNTIDFPKLSSRDSCTICLQKYFEGEKLVDFPCHNGHYFHPKCLTGWLNTNPSCPLCKKQLFSD